ncbi:hypothetical protein V757_00970 [Pelistega indica]|uniref:GmrSD restriction endonucleases N-terminal domain-containing protein n=1 Tax=Pelistega indica TaxID=1414851 RepID=V8G8X9_9BURK|nr:DUF262 domain-containing protein [Pelistega indica]ETD72954.1 hypothetical protein V757_00970 [Pelistega indica]
MRKRKNRNTVDKDKIEKQIDFHEKAIDYYITDYSIELLVQKVKVGEITIPEYQRKNIWDIPRKSKFIESVLIGLPIPFLFFWQDHKTGNMDVIDGAQRLTTLREFIEGELTLKKLEKLTDLNGCKYTDLYESRRKIFKNRPIRGVILSNKTDKEARLDLFERLNTGSVIAEPAEIRRGLLQGPFYSLVEELAQDKTFNKLAGISIQKQQKAEREEFITRFFAYADGLEEYKNEVRKFTFDYTDKMNEILQNTPNLADKYKNDFKTIMDFFQQKYPIGFRKGGKGVASRTRFEGMAISVYITYKEHPKILDKITHQDCVDVFESEEFIQIAGSDGANTKSKLWARLHYARDKFKEKYVK